MIRVRTLACAVLALVSGAAQAHPLDEIVQGAYLTLIPGEIFLELELAPGPEISASVLRSLDANADRQITVEEARAYAERVLKKSTILIDDVAVQWRLQDIVVPLYQNIELAGDVVRIYAIASRPEDHGGHTLTYDNRYQPAKSQCTANIFLQKGLGWRHQITGQQRSDDGRRLTVSFTSTRISGG